MAAVACELNPSAKDLKDASSIHVFAFSSRGELLVVESEGEFDMDEWEAAHGKARELCHWNHWGPKRMVMISRWMLTEGGSLQNMLRSAVQEKVDREQRWKESLG